ncbi:hypothetical protein ACIRU2_10570 [Streptomyces sp. NPDC101169]
MTTAKAPSLFDMAGIAVFLTTPASSYITGAVIPVGGGILTTG